MKWRHFIPSPCSYSQHHGDPTIGVYVIDRYTYYALEFLEAVKSNSNKTMGQFLRVCPKRVCISTVTSRKDLFKRNVDEVPLTDFFGSVRNVELSRSRVRLPPLLPDASPKLAVGKDIPTRRARWYKVDQFPAVS
ncbi:unnamed protein product [Ixodes pacificus]